MDSHCNPDSFNWFIAQMLKQTAGVISLKMTQLEPLQTNGKQLWVSPLHLI
jgi:hypothetical protein